MSLLGSIYRRALQAPPRAHSRLWSSIARTNDGKSLTIDALGASFPFIWLRDSCLSPTCIHPSTSQKIHRSSDIPANIQPLDGPGGITLTSDGLCIRWTDGHSSFFPQDFLRRHSSSAQLASFHRADTTRERPWSKTDISASPSLFVPYSSLEDRRGLRSAIDQLTAYGLLFVTGVPNEETSDASCELRKLAGKFSYIRETFYGQVWDVVNLRDSRNIAYTNLDLGLHMDLLYFQHPPKYQILHCLRNRVHGGASYFVDAFHAASALRLSSPEAFDILARTPVAFHYVNDGHHLHQTHPTIELADDGRISQINYSPPFQAPLPLHTPPEFYTALKRFSELLADREREYMYTLKEGDAVIFDNRRVLHARTAFSDKEGKDGQRDGEPNRWLKGCYFEADALLDRGRMLRK
ncbi:gamma-butyrobetaine dioxygenase [Roridomyces roridus]|uniref:Gamma-butyrobetaine dioxygenase n=1 Tax=Roridomyces roridus TaxID=1738132 RepID=A0AAD7B0I1_9AGAR|nr:gamma-butyrobetaine dioxygenase [Roridomyces roridus]